MDPRDDGARSGVLYVIVASVMGSAVSFFDPDLLVGTGGLPRQTGRFLLIVVLCVHLYRGSGWARWVAGALFLVSGMAGILRGVVALRANEPGFVLLLLSLVYLSCASVLFSPSVRPHFGGRR